MRCVGALVGIGLIAIASTGSAQMAAPQNVNYALVYAEVNPDILLPSAMNPQQSSLADNIVAICPNIPYDPNGYFPSATGDELDLAIRCTNIILTANSGQFGTASNALQQVAAEEVTAQQAAVAGATATQFGAIAGRVAAILASRGGTSLVQAYPTFGRGIQVASAVPMQLSELTSEDNETPLNSRLGGFATGQYGFGHHNTTVLEDGYKYYDAGGTFGVDYMLTDKWTVGGTFGYGHRNNDFSGGDGSIQTDSYVLGTYAVWLPTHALSVSGYFAYGFVNYDSDRHILYTDVGGTVDRHAKGNTDGNSMEFTVNGNYDFTLGRATVGPIVQLSYLRSTVNSFTENGAQGLNMSYNDQQARSFQTRFGGAGTYPISTSFGVVTLQGHAAWIHEYAADSRTITMKFAADPFTTSPAIVVTTDAPDRNRFGLGAGATLILPQGITAFVSFDTIVGQANYSNYVLSVGARIPL